MIKKLVSLAGAGALLLATVGPALASNRAIIKGNDATATANTGDNDQGNWVMAGDDIGSWFGGGTTNVSGNNSMSTGKAKAKAKVVIVANTNVDCCDSDCCDSDCCGDLAVVKRNDATATANTGMNNQGNSVYAGDDIKGGTTNVSGNNSMSTGNAKAKAKVFVVVNTHLSL